MTAREACGLSDERFLIQGVALNRIWFRLADQTSPHTSSQQSLCNNSPVQVEISLTPPCRLSEQEVLSASGLAVLLPPLPLVLIPRSLVCPAIRP